MRPVSKKEEKWLKVQDGTIRRLEPFMKRIENEAVHAKDKKELEENVRNYYLDMFKKYNEECYETAGLQFQLRLSTYYKHHEEEAKAIFDAIQDGKTQVKEEYIADFDEASKTFISQTIGATKQDLITMQEEVRTRLEKQSVNLPKTIEFMKKSNNFYIRAIARELEERMQEQKVDSSDQQKAVELLEEPVEPTFGDVNQYIKALPELCTEYLKEKYITALIDGKKILEAIDSFPLYIEQYEHDMERLELRDDCMKVAVEKGESKGNTIDHLFSKEYLEKCKLDELNLLNIFWQNRIAKEIKSVSNLLYMASYEHMYEKALQGEKLEEPTELEFEQIMKSKRNLDQALKYRYLHTKDIDKGIYDEEYLRNIGTKQIQYRRMNPKETRNLAKDMNDYEDWYYSELDSYTLKDNLIYQLITQLNDNHHLKNWGIVPDSMNQGDKMVLAIDYPGYNLPCMFHVHKELIKRALIGMRQNTILPMYEGNEDRNIGTDPEKSNMINCNLLLPVTKEQRKYLKTKKQELRKIFLDPDNDMPYSPTYQKYKMIDHMIAIAEGDFPDHLKEKHFENNRIQYIRKPRKYMDMETGEILIKNDKGKFAQQESR